MTASENYKEFDTTSIISRDTVSVGKLTLRKRDLLLGGIAFIALIIAIILAIVLAVEAGKKNADCQNVVNTVTDEQKGRNNTDHDTCITPICLKTASYEKYIMNETANPCINFYQFACGGYDDIYTPNQLIPEPSPYNQIRSENTQKMLYLLSYEVERPEEHSYERKLRHFLSSCTNHFDKMQIRGQPFLEQVIAPFGGWYVLNSTWDFAHYNFHNQLKMVHTTFWTPALYSLSLSTDSTNWNNKVLEIDYGGLGLRVQDYIYVSPGGDVHTLYSSYLKQLATMLSLDAKVTPNTDRISQFAIDAIEVETELAMLLYQTTAQPNAHEPANRYSLGSLTQLVNNMIDFVDYFKTQFPDVAAQFSNETTVAVIRNRFFHLLGPWLMNLTSTNDGMRKLHNYLVWQLLNNYVDDLSWDYVHAKRQFMYKAYNVKDSSSGFRYCFQVADKNMRDAIGAVFVKNYVNQHDKQEAINILELVKEEMYAAIINFSWMTAENKDSAITKIKDGLYKIGYPDFMVDDAYMDSMYSVITINEADYFSNILSLNDASRKRFSYLIAKPNSQSLWVYPIYNPNIEYYNPWHELIITAGMLQSPLFAHNGPAYSNFGGTGSLFARHLLHAVDEIGSLYKLDKSNPGVWWSNSTSEHYKDIRQCADDAQRDTPLGPFILPGGLPFTPNKTVFSYAYVPELLADASGLKLSYKAYKAKMATSGIEKIPAGFPNYSLDKMFFVAFAQAHCDNYVDLSKARNVFFSNDPPADYKVNLAVSQVQEFRQAFGCKVGDPMAPEKTCTLF
ncbi:hypothetical protein BsWGS_08005 [Bradybaena similaris]